MFPDTQTCFDLDDYQHNQETDYRLGHDAERLRQANLARKERVWIARIPFLKALDHGNSKLTAFLQDATKVQAAARAFLTFTDILVKEGFANWLEDKRSLEDPRRVALALYRLARDGKEEELQSRLNALAPNKDKGVILMYIRELPGDIYTGIDPQKEQELVLPPEASNSLPEDEDSSEAQENVSAAPQWENWAVGFDAKKWHLFKRFRKEWRQRKVLKRIPKGLQSQLMKAFVDGRGFLAKSVALKLLRSTYAAGDVACLMAKIKPAISRLRVLLRKEMGYSTSDDPLPYDVLRLGWVAKIEIGYAGEEDGQHLGGERRIRFLDYCGTKARR
jgi:hypothetical protein